MSQIDGPPRQRCPAESREDHFSAESRISRSSTVSSGWAAGRRSLVLQAIDLLDHHGDDERQDEEIQRDRDEVAIGKQRNAGLGSGLRRSRAFEICGGFASMMTKFEKSRPQQMSLPMISMFALTGRRRLGARRTDRLRPSAKHI